MSADAFNGSTKLTLTVIDSRRRGNNLRQNEQRLFVPIENRLCWNKM